MSRSKSPLLFLDLSYHHRDDPVAGHCYRIHVCDVEISGVVCRSCWRFCDSYVLRVSTLIYSAEFLRSVILINKLVKRWRLDLAWLDLGSTAIIPSSHTFGNTNIRHYRRGRKGIHKGASYSRCTPWKCSDLRYSLDWLSLFDVLFSSKTKIKRIVFITFQISMPKNQVLFECNMQMNEHDVKNYLEQIYDVPVHHVRLTLNKGEQRLHPTSRFFSSSWFRCFNLFLSFLCFLLTYFFSFSLARCNLFLIRWDRLRASSRLQTSLRHFSQRRHIRISPSGSRGRRGWHRQRCERSREGR